MPWYTIRAIRKFKIFQVNPNATFNINSILYPTSWQYPKIFFTYAAMRMTTMAFDSTAKVVNLGNGNYQIQTDSTVAANSVFDVIVYEGDY